MADTAALGGSGAVRSLLQSPPNINDIIQQAEEVRSSISQEPLALVLELVPDELAKIRQYIDEIIDRAGRYLHAWVTTPAAVNQAAVQWGNQAGQLQLALADCQMQVGDVQKHWSGTAADCFTEYATQLLGYIQDAAPAFSNVSNDLASLADSIGHLNNTVIAGGADEVVNLLQAQVDVVNSLVQQLPFFVDPPVGVIKTVSAVAATLADRLSTALQKLIDTASQVLNNLDDMQQTSIRMQDEISGKVPLSWKPEPVSLSAPCNWNPE
jgi:uncharacterized protein YukE